NATSSSAVTIHGATISNMTIRIGRRGWIFLASTSSIRIDCPLRAAPTLAVKTKRPPSVREAVLRIPVAQRSDQPPCACTTWRQGVDIFALFCARQASICDGLPTNCEQNDSASARQAIFSCMFGAFSAEACATPAITRARAIAADLMVVDLVMGAPFRLG